MKDSRLTMSRLGLLYAAYFGTIAVIAPYLAIYLRLRGFSPSRIGLILASIESAAVLSPFVLARLADRSGRYRTVMAAMIAAAILALFLMNRAPTVAALIPWAFLFGLVYKPFAPIIDALSGNVLKDSSANYGPVRLWGTVCFIAISMILQSVGVMDSSSTGLYITAFIIALAALLVTVPLAPAAPVPVEADAGAPDGDAGRMPPGYFSFLALSFIGNLGFAIHQAFGSLYYSETVGVAAVSSLFALAAFTEIPSLLYGGRILKYLGHRRMLMIALGAGVLRLMLLAVFTEAVPIYLSQLTHAFSFGFFLIVGVNWVNRMVPARRRAQGMGLLMAAGFSGAQLAGSALGGFLLEWGGFPLLFGAGSGFPLAGMIWILADRRIGRVA